MPDPEQSWAPTWTRRSLLGTAAAAGAGLVAGCGSPFDDTTRSGGKVLEFVTFYGGPDGAIMQHIVDRYNKSQDEVTVRFSAPAYGGDYLTKLLTASIAGAPPAVIAVHSFELPPLARFLHPIDLAGLGLDKADFLPAMWELPTFRDQLLGVTMSVGPLALVYNRKHFEQAGLDPDRPPTTKAEFVEAGQAIRRKTGKYAFVRDPAAWMPWLTFNWQAGGEIFDAAGRPLLDSEAAIAAAQLEQDIVGKYGIGYPKYLADGTAPLETEQVSMAFFGPWELSNVMASNTKQGTDFAVAPLPQFFDGPRAVMSTSHIYCIPKQRENDGWIQEQAGRFVSWLLREGSLEWATTQAPTSKHVMEQAKTSDDPLVKTMSVYVEQSKYAHFMPYAPRWSEAYTVLTDTMQRIAYEGAPVEREMRAVQRQAAAMVGSAS
ncbi:ABC transporter substrate-binding protein [Flindersiella endophytica]